MPPAKTRPTQVPVVTPRPEARSLSAETTVEESRQGALDLARDPNLIGRIQQDIKTVGIVGEEDNALLIHLTYTSRLLDSPGAVVTRGASSTGKTSLLIKVGELIPPEAKVETMSMTSASMFNSPEDYFSHKVVITGERRHATDDTAHDSTATIRQMLSEKKISRMVSVKDAEGHWVSQLVTREGPIAYAESTTAGTIFEEDLNRLIQIYTDTSALQSLNIMLATASKYDLARSEDNVEATIELHHEFQRLLVTRDVYIPYARRLAELMPADKPESRRVFQQLLTVVESIVVLHQFQRKEQDGYLVATYEDYALARRLLLSPIHASIGAGKDFKKAETLIDRLKKPDIRDTFTTPEVTKAMGYKSAMGASHLLGSLIDAKLVTCLSEATKNKPAVYEWSNDREWDVLPTVEKLRKET